MLPNRHVIVHARARFDRVGFSPNGEPRSTVCFAEGYPDITPEDLLGWVSAYPKNVLLVGDPLHQDLEFLQLVLIDLTNNDHIVTVGDLGDRMIPWKLVMPNVQYKLRADLNFNHNNYLRLEAQDTVIFDHIDDLASYEIAKAKIRHAQKHVSDCQFELSGSWPHLTAKVLDDSLEVRVRRRY